MKYQLTITYPQEAYTALKPEEAATERAKVTITPEKISIEANDASALKAMATSMLRLLTIWERT